MRIIVGLTALLLCATALPVTPLAAQGATVNSGSWIWVKRPASHPAQRESVTLTVNSDNRSGRYCNVAYCKDVIFTIRGNVYSFTTGANNWFEFESSEPAVFIGKFWFSKANVSQPADAVIRMQEQ